jgi:hypothetical protein
MATREERIKAREQGKLPPVHNKKAKSNQLAKHPVKYIKKNGWF